jgi:hypothetical protein
VSTRYGSSSAQARLALPAGLGILVEIDRRRLRRPSAIPTSLSAKACLPPLFILAVLSFAERPRAAPALKTKEGGLLYFHRNSILSGEFDKLRRGDEVMLRTWATPDLLPAKFALSKILIVEFFWIEGSDKSPRVGCLDFDAT